MAKNATTISNSNNEYNNDNDNENTTRVINGNVLTEDKTKTGQPQDK